MMLLKSLYFIDIKLGKLGDISHLLIFNPHHNIRYHHQQKTPALALGLSAPAGCIL